MLLAQIASSASVTICMLVDSIMIGQFLGVDAVAAYGIASPVLFVFAAIGALMSTGIQVVCSRSISKGDTKTTNNCYTAAILLALTVSVIGLLVVYFFTGSICSLLGAQPGTRVFDLTGRYLRGFMFGAPSFILSQILVPFMLLSNNRSRLVVAVLVMSVSDIAMDFLNVILFKGGMFGMGAASALSYYFALIIAAFYLFSKDCLYKFDIKGFRLRNCAEMLRNGIPTAVNQLCYTGQVFIINQILLSGGHSDAVAVYSVLSTLGALCFSAGAGIGSVALSLAGVFHVEEDRHSIYELVNVFVRFAIWIDLALTVVLVLISRLMMGMFISGSEGLLDFGTMALRIFLLCLLPSSLNSSFKNYYLGIERIRFSEVISFLQNLLFPVLAALLMYFTAGVGGIWFCFLIGETLTLLTICVVVWIRSGHVSFKAPDFALLEPDFGVSDDDVMDIPIETAEDVSRVSEEASSFCAGHGGDKRTCSRLALCIEEIGINIIKHGFSDGKDHNMQLRIIKKDDTWMIGFRDDCKGFDPVKYKKKQVLDNSFSMLGLRLVFETASDIRYVNALGLNNLTITL